MFAQRQVFRALRSPAIQRRFASTAPKAGENAFVAERRAVKEHAAESTALWKKISIFVCIPALVGASVNAYVLWNEHWEHWSHMPPLEERVEYPYQNIRTKNFTWGDGDKTLFWNDKVNYHNKDKTA
ncbi:Cytochrome c oxidase subunit 13, mitochondrial [Gnomoniopsis smithogilvyi]|uniref:Cytochrome c oxidase subunit n=1 Tax=Gnomoniopsis smithogilvyi TaxID=1191159 RepID=A0A9W8YJ33_9PEZI|nr:Cytochrome c oxidase subunit 13, mitochondrial [Gnomoniopsis smithogilvyi]